MFSHDHCFSVLDRGLSWGLFPQGLNSACIPFPRLCLQGSDEQVNCTERCRQKISDPFVADLAFILLFVSLKICRKLQAATAPKLNHVLAPLIRQWWIKIKELFTRSRNRRSAYLTALSHLTCLRWCCVFLRNKSHLTAFVGCDWCNCWPSYSSQLLRQLLENYT